MMGPWSPVGEVLWGDWVNSALVNGITCSRIVGLRATVGAVLFAAQVRVLSVHKAGFNSQHQQKEHTCKTELALSTMLSFLILRCGPSDLTVHHEGSHQTLTLCL